MDISLLSGLVPNNKDLEEVQVHAVFPNHSLKYNLSQRITVHCYGSNVYFLLMNAITVHPCVLSPVD